MKRIFTTALVVFAAAAYANTNVQNLNLEVAKLLAPFQSESTQAEIVFRDLKTDTERTLNFDVRGLFKKIGTQDTLQLSVDPVQYFWGAGQTEPSFKVAGRLALNLSRHITQEDFNKMVPDLETFISDFAKDIAKAYGEAVTVEAKISDKTQDSQGNYSGIMGLLQVDIDLSKLPADIPPADMPLRSAKLQIDLSLKTGAGLTLSGVLNSGYKGFQKDEQGLKEYVDRLLQQDQELLNQLQSWIKQLDSWSEGLVN